MEYTSDRTNILVIGGGNIGTQFACKCASKGFKVNVFSSRPELYDGSLEIVDEFGNVTTGKLNKVTSNMEEAIAGCGIIFVSYPAFLFRETADKILPYIKEGMVVCILPGTGGAEFAFRDCIKKGCVLCGLQRVPSVARLEKYGKRVRCEGLRKELFLATIPGTNGKDISQFFCALWEMPCLTLPNYLSVTLTPSNPILHTTRLCTLFSDYEEGKVYKRNPLFYGEWDDKSSELLIACDTELQQMVRMMDKLDLHNVCSLKVHYESKTIEEMTQKLCSIKSLHNLSSPMKRVENGWIPDFSSRYFTADFPYGLAIIEVLACIIGCDVPNIEKTMKWYRDVTGNNQRFKLEDYGIHKVEDIYALYR